MYNYLWQVTIEALISIQKIKDKLHIWSLTFMSFINLIPNILILCIKGLYR